MIYDNTHIPKHKHIESRAFGSLLAFLLFGFSPFRLFSFLAFLLFAFCSLLLTGRGQGRNTGNVTVFTAGSFLQTLSHFSKSGHCT